jgi:hypothetical protein
MATDRFRPQVGLVDHTCWRTASRCPEVACCHHLPERRLPNLSAGSTERRLIDLVRRPRSRRVSGRPGVSARRPEAARRSPVWLRRAKPINRLQRPVRIQTFWTKFAPHATGLDAAERSTHIILVTVDAN